MAPMARCDNSLYLTDTVIKSDRNTNQFIGNLVHTYQVPGGILNSGEIDCIEGHT